MLPNIVKIGQQSTE